MMAAAWRHRGFGPREAEAQGKEPDGRNRRERARTRRRDGSGASPAWPDCHPVRLQRCTTAPGGRLCFGGSCPQDDSLPRMQRGAQVPDWRELATKLRLTFKDPALLRQALVHTSYLNENPGIDVGSNERLEFLGDAALGVVVAQELYQEYPDDDEGTLTELRAHLVRRDTLARAAARFDLGEYLQLGRGEDAAGGRQPSDEPRPRVRGAGRRDLPRRWSREGAVLRPQDAEGRAGVAPQRWHAVTTPSRGCRRSSSRAGKQRRRISC